MKRPLPARRRKPAKRNLTEADVDAVLRALRDTVEYAVKREVHQRLRGLVLSVPSRRGGCG